jgi:hypothetical protein
MFKVISPIDKKGGGTFWTRCGTAFTNKDESINVYLDVFPKSFQLQLRELTEEDLARKASYADSIGSRSPSPSTRDPHDPSAPSASSAIPF